MSFANYKKSPFDEAMSKPLISTSNAKHDNNHNADTQRVTMNNNTTNNSKSSLSSSNNAAVYSKKITSFLSPQSLSSPPQPPPESFQSFHNKNQHDYQPPNLTHETTTMTTATTTATTMDLQHQSLEEALLIERNNESRSILHKMSTISAISTELNNLLSSQQDDIDEIETNAYYVHDAAERGVNELESANRLGFSRNNVDGIWKYFFGVVSVGGFIIALIIFLHSF